MAHKCKLQTQLLPSSRFGTWLIIVSTGSQLCFPAKFSVLAHNCELSDYSLDFGYSLNFASRLTI